jgi:type III secretory pathway component EscR
MEKPKILILIMSANNDFFRKQMEDVKKTWIKLLYIENTKKIIDQYCDEIDWFYYDNNEEFAMDISQQENGEIFFKKTPDVIIDQNDPHHLITTYYSDRLTWHKTYSVFKYLYKENEKIYDKFDYVIRTNTSTYVNLPALVYTLYRDFNAKTINDISNTNLTYGVELISSVFVKTPKLLDIYTRGNLMVLTKQTIKKTILKFGQLLQGTTGGGESDCNLIDDVMIGNIINSVNNNFDEDSFEYLKYYRALPFNWFKTVEHGYNIQHKSSSKGLESNFETDSENYQYNIGIQIKNYMNRTLESEHYQEFHQEMLTNVFPNYSEETLSEIYDKINNYSKNPSVFVLGNLPHYSLNVISKNIQNKYAREFWINYIINHLPNDVWLQKTVQNLTQKYIEKHQ